MSNLAMNTALTTTTAPSVTPQPLMPPAGLMMNQPPLQQPLPPTSGMGPQGRSCLVFGFYLPAAAVR